MSLRANTYRIVADVSCRIRGLQISKNLKFLEQSQWWPPESIHEFQNEALHKLLQYVYDYVPYYRTVMDKLGLKPRDIQTTEDIVKLPVLTKENLRKDWKDLVSTQANSLKTSIRKTGGSTGEPLRVMNDYSNSAWEMAAFRRGLGFGGYRFGEPIVKLFGGTLGLVPEGFLKKVKARFSGVVFLPAFEIGPDTIDSYAETIRRSGVRFLRGYASAVYLLAKMTEDTNLNVSLKAVFPTAETLYDFQREAIAKSFQCKVFNQYGCGECNSIAFECPSHNGLHASDEHVFLEVLRDEERVPDGQMGAVTLTTLHNYAMPLIRYQNGDLISLSEKACSCGRGLSRITKIYGRANDLLLAKDGRLVSATFLPSICVNVDLGGIQQFQVIQESQDTIYLKIVKTSDFTDDQLVPVFEVFRRYLGDVKIDVEYVGSIPASSQGKSKYVISKFGESFLHNERQE